MKKNGLKITVVLSLVAVMLLGSYVTTNGSDVEVADSQGFEKTLRDKVGNV